MMNTLKDTFLISFEFLVVCTWQKVQTLSDVTFGKWNNDIEQFLLVNSVLNTRLDHIHILPTLFLLRKTFFFLVIAKSCTALEKKMEVERQEKHEETRSFENHYNHSKHWTCGLTVAVALVSIVLFAVMVQRNVFLQTHYWNFALAIGILAVHASIRLAPLPANVTRRHLMYFLGMCTGGHLLMIAANFIINWKLQLFLIPVLVLEIVCYGLLFTADLIVLLACTRTCFWCWTREEEADAGTGEDTKGRDEEGDGMGLEELDLAAVVVSMRPASLVTEDTTLPPPAREVV